MASQVFVLPLVAEHYIGIALALEGPLRACAATNTVRIQGPHTRPELVDHQSSDAAGIRCRYCGMLLSLPWSDVWLLECRSGVSIELHWVRHNLSINDMARSSHWPMMSSE
jgi:hypothetical protein